MPVAPLDRDRPKRRRRPTPTQRAKAQEKQYVSQGKAVEHAARQQRATPRSSTPTLGRTPPKVRQTPVQRARSQEKRYGSQGIAVKRAAKQQRATAERRRRAARRKTFSKKPAVALQRKINRGQRALALLESSDPAAYARRRQEARDFRVGPVNVEKLGREAARRGAQGAEEVRKHLRTTGNGPALTRTANQAGFAGEGAREVLDLVANAPTSAYEASAATVEAAKGDTKRARKLWKDFKDTSAVAAAASGNGKEALRRASERPVTTALEISGLKAGLGRTLGAAARHAPIPHKGFRARVRAVGSTKRPNLKLYADQDAKRVKGGRGPEEQRAYSRDIFNKAGQRYIERRTAKGSRVRKHGKNAGTQRRPPRDPHVDQGSYLVPASSLTKGRAGAPVRRRLDRRVDTRYFSQSRVMERRRRDAERAAKKEQKEGGTTHTDAARADMIRTEIRERARKVDPKERKHLREIAALSDEKLIDMVEASAREKLGGRGERTVAGLKGEQAAIAAKALERRVRRGRPLTSAQARAVKVAVRKQIERDVRVRKQGKPLAPNKLAAAVANVHLGTVPKGMAERRSVNRPNRPEPLRPRDFAPYFDTQIRRVPTERAPILPRQQDVELAAMRPAPGDVPGMAGRRAMYETGLENQRLLADEFGIRIGKKGTRKSRDSVQQWIVRQGRENDLVPMMRSDSEWVAAPRQVVERLNRHRSVDESALGPGSPFDRVSSNFKDVVLTSASPSKWLGGNVADIGMRSLFEGITPADVARGIGVDRRLKQKGLQGEQASQSLHQGGLYTTGGQGALGQDLLTGAGKPISKANVPRHLWRAWKRSIYSLEHAIETLPQYGTTGKAMRRDTARQRDSLRGLLKMTDEMLDSYAEGIATNRAMEARLQKNVEDVIGRWGKVSPGMRRALSIAPFAQWLGAATRYVYVTLPVHHPIKTSILAGITEMTEEERKRLGLSYFAPTDQRAPDYQMGMLPIKVGKNKYGPVVEGVRTSRMTSFGTAGSSPWNIPEFLLPQFSSGLNALRGQSFTGEPLVYGPDAGPDKEGLPLDFADLLPVALGAQAESMVPFAGAFRRSILERGRPADPSSTILTPKTRPVFNYDKKRYEERPAAPLAGLKEWAGPFAGPPFTDLSRIYTLGAGRDIERSQNTLRQLEQWNKRRKKKQEKAEEYGTPQLHKSGSENDFWGGSVPTKPKVQTKKPKDDFWR